MSLHRHRFEDVPAEDVQGNSVVRIGHDEFFVVHGGLASDDSGQVVLVLDSPDGWTSYRCAPGTLVPTCPAR